MDSNKKKKEIDLHRFYVTKIWWWCKYEITAGTEIPQRKTFHTLIFNWPAFINLNINAQYALIEQVYSATKLSGLDFLWF